MSRLLSLAARNLLRHRRRSVLSGLAIASRVVALVLIAGLSEGFLEFLATEVAEGRTGSIQVHRAGYLRSAQGAPLRLSLPDDEAFRSRLRSVEGVRAVSARLVFTGQVSNGRMQAAVLARGLEIEVEDAVCPRALDGLLPKLASGGLLLGGGLTAAMGSRPGDVVALSAVGPTGRANAMDARLAGGLGGLYAWDSSRTAALPLRLAQSLTGMEGRVTEYAVALEVPGTAGAVAARLKAALGPEVEVHTWAELTPFLRDALFYLRWMVGFAGLLLAVVVAAGITNTMTVSVYERTREIGTQLAVGMRRRDVRRLFLIEAAVLGVLAAVVGVAVGGRGRFARRSRRHSWPGMVHPGLDWAVALVAAVGAVATALVAGLLPAHRAARLAPVEALRGRGSA
ncbi:MAG: ABC transporter permease [Myxococcaceae bacterium]